MHRNVFSVSEYNTSKFAVYGTPLEQQQKPELDANREKLLQDWSMRHVTLGNRGRAHNSVLATPELDSKSAPIVPRDKHAARNIIHRFRDDLTGVPPHWILQNN